jgi:hypothetical protein
MPEDDDEDEHEDEHEYEYEYEYEYDKWACSSMAISEKGKGWIARENWTC